jgi:hypothetical protein
MTLIFAVFTFLIAPFLLPGLINKSKALWAGRHGAPIWQPGYDFLKLLRKGQVISKTTSFAFRLAPSVNLAAVILAALINPIPQQTALLNFPGDFVLFAYALGLARFLLVAAAMDTGSSFEGMGAAREMTFASIVEPAFFMLIGTLALMTRQSSLSAIVANLDDGAGFAMLVKSLGTIVLFIMLLVEGISRPCRRSQHPSRTDDDPRSHDSRLFRTRFGLYAVCRILKNGRDHHPAGQSADSCGHRSSRCSSAVFWRCLCWSQLASQGPNPDRPSAHVACAAIHFFDVGTGVDRICSCYVLSQWRIAMTDILIILFGTLMLYVLPQAASRLLSKPCLYRD